MEAETTKRSSRSFYFEIFLVATAVILLEVSQTRIFSFKVFYYFTYLIIGLSLLGLGSGGVLVPLSPALRRSPAVRLVPLACLAASVTSLVGYFVVALVQFNASELTTSPIETAKLAVICAALFAPFSCAGVVIAKVFSEQPARINRLYFADLGGAGLGCAAVVYLMRAVTPPGCVMLCGLLFALAGLPLTLREWRAWVPLPVVVAAASLVGVLAPAGLPDPIPDVAKNMAPHKLVTAVEVLHSEWSPIFRVDVIAVDEGFYGGHHYLSHDGLIGSTITRFDGRLESASYFDSDMRSIPMRVLGGEPVVLIIGAAGGREVLAARYLGASEILAVELNPITVSLMTDKFAEFSGRLMLDKRVTLINAEGRSYVNQLDRKVDLIWLVAPDSYSAMNAATSGAFVLTESYLYTAEMIIESLDRLGDDGILCAQFGEFDFLNRAKRTPRYLATAREALRRLGIADFEKHVLVVTTPDYILPAVTILVKRKPFSEQEILRFRAASKAIDRALAGEEVAATPPAPESYRKRVIVWHAAGEAADTDGDHPINRVISLPDEELARWLDGFTYDVSPVTDDAPFFWHFVRFRNALLDAWAVKSLFWDHEDATGERVLIVLLLFSAVFAAAAILLPLLVARDTWRQLEGKTEAFLYFSALGLGFMFFEVSLIQQLTLFLGYPTYSLTVTLFSILVSAGVGSLLTERYAAPRSRALGVLFGVLAALMLWYQFGVPWVVYRSVALPFWLRVPLAVAFVAPLGLCLGAFMPIGLNAVSTSTQYKQEFVAWAWAINGYASVVASVLATIVSMTIGFRWLMLVAVLIYGVGVLALSRFPASRRVSSVAEPVATGQR